MIGIDCRSLRLTWIAGLGLALALVPAASAASVATQTTLHVATSEHDGRTQATATITVTGVDGVPATGAVSLEDGDIQLAQVALNSEGQGTAVMGLAGGEHSLRAVYVGDGAHRASFSRLAALTTPTSSTPNFTITLAPVAPSTLPLTLKAGVTGTIAVTVVPQNNASLTAPMFVTLSCSGLPSLSSCTFTPDNIEILSTTPTSCPTGSPASSCPPVSSMLIQTQAQTASVARPDRKSSPVSWAILVPGIIGLGGLAWGARRRRWLERLSLVALAALVTLLGTTGCAPLYDYYHHGPGQPISTPTGTFTVSVTGQSSDGITAITNSTSMVLTVQ